jgi:protein O-GlcNAc transferase
MTEHELFQTAVRAHQSGDFANAEAQYRQLIESNFAHAGALYMLGKIFVERNQPEQAKPYFRDSTAAAPGWIDPIVAYAHLLLDSGEIEQVEQIVLQLHSTHANDIRLHRLAATMFAKARRPEGVIQALRKTASFPEATSDDWLALADIERNIGNLSGARTAATTAWRLDNTSAEAALFNAALSQYQGRFQDAAQYYDAAYALGDRGDWLYQFAEALRLAGDFKGWERLISELPPEQSMSLQGQRLALERAQYCGDFLAVNQSIVACEDSPSRDEKTALEEYSFLRLFFDHSSAQHKKHYGRVNTAWSIYYPQNTPRNAVQDANAARPLRVGYLSADFRDHVMGRMAAVMIEHRDKARHKALCYGLNAAEDDLTARIGRSADIYIRCAGVSDENIALRIAADKLDVLVDLSGPTDGGRPGVLARKPAPILITHVGAAGPIGLSTVDYKITDSIADDPENQSYLIERLLPMGGCCYPVPKYPLPTAGVPKGALGLEGRVVIGAFYAHYKLSERCVRLWKRVIDANPEVCIAFSPLMSELEPAYSNLMRAAEISQSNYFFMKAGPTEAERLARYRVVDFVMDSMPYGGVNGTLEALYMGIPVVTLLGTHHSERTSASMLSHLGVLDTIAQSPSEYVSIATKLTKSASVRTDVSNRIRARWPKFADPIDYARRWEAVLRQVVR